MKVHSWNFGPSDLIPRSVYLHVPFCRHRCGYCNFTLVAGRDHLVDDYLRAIAIELSSIDLPTVNDRISVDTIYLGGGTPSRLSAKQLRQLLNQLQERFELDPEGEFTIEANPDDLPGDIANVIEESPINRISLGVQSFDADKLKSLDRDHSRKQIDEAVAACRSIVERFSVDLIFAAPHDSLAILQTDLQLAIESGAGHVSTYELTFEKGTKFWTAKHHGDLTAKPDDTCADMYEATIATMTNAGYEHYEISSFAKPQQRSRHNQIYWTGRPYFAFGPGAAGLVGRTRYNNDRSVGRYLKKVLAAKTPVVQSQEMTDRELANERVVFGLRKIEGIDASAFQLDTGFAITELIEQSVLGELIELGLIEANVSECLKLTKRGLMVGDYVCSRIV